MIFHRKLYEVSKHTITAPDASMNSNVEEDESSHRKNADKNQSSPVDVESKITKIAKLH